MRRSAVAAALMAAAAVSPAEAAVVEVWNVMTANPYNARLAVEDVRYADGHVDMGPHALGRSLSLGERSVTSFILVAQTAQSGLAFGIRCTAEAGYARVDVENPWTVVAGAGCTVAARGTVEPGNAIRWD